MSKLLAALLGVWVIGCASPQAEEPEVIAGEVISYDLIPEEPEAVIEVTPAPDESTLHIPAPGTIGGVSVEEGDHVKMKLEVWKKQTMGPCECWCPEP